MEQEQKQYYAFISYNHDDKNEARELQHWLEYYKLPTNLRKENPDLPKYVRPLFRDETHLEIGDLTPQICEGLEQSQFLIVICSPRSANSEWVNKEIEYFIEIGKQDKIIPYIIEGVPHSKDPDEECFPPALLSICQEKEILGANINESGRHAASIRVVAKMFNLRPDILYQRYQKERRRKIFSISLLIIWIISLLGYLLWSKIQYNNELKEKNETILQQNLMLDERNDSIEAVNRIILAAQDSLERQQHMLHTAYDEVINSQTQLKESNAKLRESNILLEDLNQNITQTNNLLERANGELQEANVKIQNERNEILKGQARYVAKEAEKMLIDGNGMNAIFLLLHVLPKNIEKPNRPYSSAAEKCLRAAIDSITAPGWNSIGILQDENRSIEKFAYSAETGFLATVSSDGSYKLWDAYSLQLLASMQGSISKTERMCFLGDSCVIASGRDFVHVWNYRKGEHIEYHKEEVGDSICTVLVLPNSDEIIVVSENGIFRQFGYNKAPVTILDMSVYGINISDCVMAGKRIWCLERRNGSLLVNVDLEKKTLKSNYIPHWTSTVSLSPDSKKLLLTDGLFGEIVICDAETLKMRHHKSPQTDNPKLSNIDYGHIEHIHHAVWCENNDGIYMLWSDGRVTKYSCDLSRQIEELPYYDPHLYSSNDQISFSGNNEFLICSSAHNLRIYKNNSTKGFDDCIYDGGSNTISTAFFSNDGSKVFFTHLASNKIQVLDVESKKVISSLEGRIDPYFYHKITFSPDESILISGSTSDMIMGKNNLIESVREDKTISDDKTYIVDGVSSKDIPKNHPIRLFDTRTFKEIPFDGKGYIPSISPNNEYLISSQDGIIYKYRLGSEQYPDTLHGSMPQYCSNGYMTYNTRYESHLLNDSSKVLASFQGHNLLVFPNQRVGVTEGTHQIGIWNLSGKMIFGYDFGKSLVSAKHIINDSILLVVTQGYGDFYDGNYAESDIPSMSLKLLDIYHNQIINEEYFKGERFEIAADKSECYILDESGLSIITIPDFDCVSYLSVRKGNFGKQHPLQVSKDKKKILYLDKQNRLMIHYNVSLQSLINNAWKVFYNEKMSEYMKHKYYLE